MVIYDTVGNIIGTETISGIRQIQDCAYDSIAQVLYTTDRVRGCIYKTTFAAASPHTPHTSIWVSNLTKPSAIIWQKSNNRLLLVQDTANTKILAVSISDSSVQTVRSTNIKNAMGLAEDAQGNLYIASVGDKCIYQLNKYYSGNPKVLLSEPKPGDITIVSERNEWVYTCIICGKVFVADIHLFGADSEIVGCAGDSVTTYKNPFIKNIGTFDTGNEFILELSDDKGNFDKGYELNRVSDTLIPAKIDAVLPSNIPAGMGYRMRWSSTKPKITGAIQMTQILEAPSLLLSDKGFVRYDCDGKGIRLRAQDSAQHTDYTWRVNGTVIPDSTQFLTVKGKSQNTQNVHLSAKQSLTGCTARDSVRIVFSSSPQVASQWPMVSVCYKDSVTLGDTSSSSIHQYSWKNGRGWSSQWVKPHYLAVERDTFHCTITSAQGCVAQVSQVLNVTFYDSVRWVRQSDTLLEVASKWGDTLYWFYNGKLLRADKQTQQIRPDSGWYNVCTGLKKRLGQVGCVHCIEGFYVKAKPVSGTQSFEQAAMRIYPNPAGVGSDVVLSIQGNGISRNIVVYNSVGSKVSSYRIGSGQQQITLVAPSAGIYFIEVEGAGKLLKWMVE
jgi:hypothetical protein